MINCTCSGLASPLATANGIAQQQAGMASTRETLVQELTKLESDDRHLDEQIRHLMFESKSLIEAGPSAPNAYVTFDDLRTLPSMQDQTILAIKAPVGTRLEVPDPDEDAGATGRRRFQIHLKSDKAIDIYLVSKQDGMPMEAPVADVANDMAPPIVDPVALADAGLLRPSYPANVPGTPISPGGPVSVATSAGAPASSDNVDYYLNMYNADGLTDFYGD
jgi:hypothetical protein